MASGDSESGPITGTVSCPDQESSARRRAVGRGDVAGGDGRQRAVRLVHRERGRQESGVPAVAAAQVGDSHDALDALSLDGVTGRAGETEVVLLDVIGARVRGDEPQDAAGALERFGEDLGAAVGALRGA